MSGKGRVAVERVKIDAGEGREVSGVLARPGGAARIGVVVAHGAGQDMESPLCVSVADGLSALGHATLRFNFPYKERGRGAPDPPRILHATYLAAATLLAGSVERVVYAGKSMGGRIGSEISAKGAPAAGVVLLGYPLQPVGRPQQLRDKHLPDVAAPMLFVQGTRDKLCDLAVLRPILARIGPRARLHVVEGGDHSLDLLKSAGRPRSDVHAEVVRVVDAWIRESVR